MPSTVGEAEAVLAAGKVMALVDSFVRSHGSFADSLKQAG